MTAQPTVIIVDDDPGISAIRTCWTQFSWVWSEIARLENEKATAALRALRYSHPREPEVMALVVTGRLNKQTAYDIGSARSRKGSSRPGHAKDEGGSLPDLARMADKLDFTAETPRDF
jgi:FixJ family two-component response regulator